MYLGLSSQIKFAVWPVVVCVSLNLAIMRPTLLESELEGWRRDKGLGGTTLSLLTWWFEATFSEAVLSPFCGPRSYLRNKLACSELQGSLREGGSVENLKATLWQGVVISVECESLCLSKSQWGRQPKLPGLGHLLPLPPTPWPSHRPHPQGKWRERYLFRWLPALAFRKCIL